MANTEQIEAKLCAYVDGDLDAAARAEIEQHLAANPQHRQLLAELMEQRNLLRDLPREKAPDDLFDSFQTQLERSVLLDANRPALVGRRHRSSQVMALAAILLLAIGLAAVIKFVLPDKSKQRDYAVIPTTAPAASEIAGSRDAIESGSLKPPTLAVAAPAPAMTLRDSLEKNAGKSAIDETKSIDVASVAPATQSTVALGASQLNGVFSKADAIDQKADKNGLNSQMATINGPVALAPIDADIEKRVNRSPQVPDNSMVVVVATANRAATDQEVTGYLAMNKIRWDDVPEPMPEISAAAKGESQALKQEARSLQSPKLEGGRKEESQKALVTQSDGEPAPSIAPNGSKDAEALKQSVAAVPTTQPSLDRAGAPGTPGVVSDKLAIQQQQIQVPSTQPRYIVARGLTQSQVSELYSCIAAQNTGSIANYRRANGAITPTTLPVAPTMQSNAPTTQQGQQITFAGGFVNGAFGGGGGDESRKRDFKSATTMATATRQIAEHLSPATAPAGGQIVDQPIAPVATATTAPTVARTAAPTTQPALTPSDIAAAALAVSPSTPATTAPTSQAVTITTATQQLSPVTTAAPSGAPTTSPSDERVDVVIVVKSTVPDPSAPNAAAPSVMTPVVSTPVAPPAPVAPTTAPAPATQPTWTPVLKARRNN